MIHQLDMFRDYSPPKFIRHSPTSEAAAKALKPRRITELHTRILAHIAKGGATDEEIFNAIPDVPPNTLRPRRIELVEMGRIRDSGQTRATRSGRQAVIWIAIPNEIEQAKAA